MYRYGSNKSLNFGQQSIESLFIDVYRILSFKIAWKVSENSNNSIQKYFIKTRDDDWSLLLHKER